MCQHEAGAVEVEFQSAGNRTKLWGDQASPHDSRIITLTSEGDNMVVTTDGYILNERPDAGRIEVQRENTIRSIASRLVLVVDVSLGQNRQA